MVALGISVIAAAIIAMPLYKGGNADNHAQSSAAQDAALTEETYQKRIKAEDERQHDLQQQIDRLHDDEAKSPLPPPPQQVRHADFAEKRHRSTRKPKKIKG